MQADREAIISALRLILEPGQATELRALEVSTPDYRRPHTVSGYFDDPARLAAEAVKVAGQARATYFVPNPVNPALLARAQNRTRAAGERDPSTSDTDVLKRRWLLVDLDANRPSGISSTEAEHEAALVRAREIRAAQTAEGWPEPLYADSGNGAHLMYRLDLPRDDGELVKRCLEALAFRFGDELVGVDLKVFNPARIWKLYGTPSRKGDDTAERPHRLARLLEAPAELQVVSRELLEALAAQLPVAVKPKRNQLVGAPFDGERWIAEHNLDVIGPRAWQGGRKWLLRVCPWNPEHRDRSAYIVQFADGAMAAGCHHNGCNSRGWRELREMLEPGCYDQPPAGGHSNGKVSRAVVDEEDPLARARAVLASLQEQVMAKPAEALRTALEAPETVGALALVCSQDRPSFESALLRFRDLGVKDRDVRALEKAVNAERRKRTRTLRAVGPGEEPQLVPVKQVLPEAPVLDQAVVPAGWRLSANGVAREATSSDDGGGERTSLTPVAPTPIVITGRLRDVHEGKESCHLSWLRDGTWRHHISDRATVANARALVELAGQGLPVTSGTAGELVSYLAAFESANLELLPRAHVSHQMGWQGDGGKLGFLWGRILLRPDGVEAGDVNVEAIPPEEWSEDWIAFRGEDGGDEQIADAFHASGSFESWLEAIKVISGYPRVALTFFGALAPPLQAILEAPNFTIDNAFATSTGKTTMLRVAASCWGCPDERAPASVIGTWDATRVWIERASTILNGLPLILDDTKRAKNLKQVAQTIYDVASGRGKGRGSPRGMRRAGSWCTVLLSTGEAPITSFTEDGGTHGRVLSLWGPPFGAADEQTAPIVHGLDLAIRQHYGHAGPRLVQYAMQHRDEWDAWRVEYRKVQTDYLERAGSNPVAGRYAAYFAVLDMTAALANVALGLPWDYHDPVEALWDELVAGADEADRARVALDYVISWAKGHQNDFWGRHASDINGNPRMPHDGWAGRWDRGPGWEYIGFLPHRLKAILVAAGYEVDPTLRLWKDRGWLVVADKRNTTLARVDGEPARLVALRREACEPTDNESGVTP